MRGAPPSGRKLVWGRSWFGSPSLCYPSFSFGLCLLFCSFTLSLLVSLSCSVPSLSLLVFLALSVFSYSVPLLSLLVSFTVPLLSLLISLALSVFSNSVPLLSLLFSLALSVFSCSVHLLSLLFFLALPVSYSVRLCLFRCLPRPLPTFRSHSLALSLSSIFFLSKSASSFSFFLPF